MEIFVSNIDHSCHDLDLRQALANVLHRPPISPVYAPRKVNFHLRRWKQKNKAGRLASHAAWTIEDREAARRFLEHHGGRTSGIIVGGRTLFFQESTSAAQPELLRMLLDGAFVEPAVERAKQEALRSLADPIPIRGFDFGRLWGSTYSPEYSPSLTTSHLSFDGAKRALIILSTSRTPSASSISIDFSSIIRMESLPGTSPSVLLTLCRPPVFRKVADPFAVRSLYAALGDLASIFENGASTDPQLKRTGALDEQHRAVAAFVGHHLRITFATPADLEKFRHRRTEGHVPRVVDRRNFKVSSEGLYDLDRLKALRKSFGKLDLRVAFQLEGLLHGEVLDPTQLAHILPAIDVLSEDIEPEVLEQVLVQFRARLISTSREKYRWSAGEGWREDIAEPSRPVAPTIQRRQERAMADIGLGATNEQLKSLLIDVARYVRSSSAQRKTFAYVSRQVTITPTAIRLEGPYADNSNSVIRQYPQHSFYFIRVSVREADYNQYFHSDDLLAFLRERYRDFFVNGLALGGRVFDFLGWSNSALREHSTWFVAPFWVNGSKISAESIRRNMGDFSNVNRIPARRLARISQAFTATSPSIVLSSNQLRRIPDIEFGSSCFTDGVGTISSLLAEDVDHALMASKLKKKGKSTCYQVRLGGIKGMLSLDPTLSGKVICYRKSQLKFDAPRSLGLNVALSFSKPLPAYLNRPLIKILEDLGIATDVFLRLQRTAVRSIESARDTLAGAAQLLDDVGLGTGSHLSHTLRVIGRSTAVKKLGRHFDDLFLRECVDLAVVTALRAMKWKSRIFIPQAYTLVGIADEATSGYLKEGEIYACIKRSGEDPIYLEGVVAITRSPTVHPGDVQLVRAVGRIPDGIAPQVSVHTNAVVFSVRGKRSLPSCLGGGDLDGDLYQIIADPELIPTQRSLSAPGVYEPAKMVHLPSACTIEDGADFFFTYITSDLTGVIGSRHLHLADASSQGTRSPECLKLANLASRAVDFCKTGTPVHIHELPKAPAAKPDFMIPEHQAHRIGEGGYYESKKALGVLFRDIPLKRVTLEAEHDYQNSTQDPSGVSLDCTRSLTKALSRLWQLPVPDDERREIMAQHMESFSNSLLDIYRSNTLSRRRDRHLTEVEAFVGTIIAPARDARHRKHLMERLQVQTQELFEETTEIITGGDFYCLDEQLSRAWAAWHAALDEDQSQFGVKSFGWLAIAALVEIVEETE